MQQSPSWEGHSFSSSEESPHILLSVKDLHRDQNNMQHILVLSYINP